MAGEPQFAPGQPIAAGFVVAVASARPVGLDMARCVVFTVGADRPGIVAAVTESLAQHGANLQDCAMSQLGGQFAMVVLADSERVTPEELAAHLRTATAAFDLDVHVRAIAASSEHTVTTHLVSVYGADRPGIVRDISGWLAGHSINIVDLETHVLESDPPTYAMLIEVALPPNATDIVLQEALRSAAPQWGVQADLRRVEHDQF